MVEYFPGNWSFHDFTSYADEGDKKVFSEIPSCTFLTVRIVCAHSAKDIYPSATIMSIYIVIFINNNN